MATTRIESALRAFTTPIRTVIVLLIFCFLYVGLYFLSYHVFFLQLPFEDIVERKYPRFNEKVKWSWPNEEFAYPGFAYFDGIRLEPSDDKGNSEAITASYVSPWILDLKQNKKIELFVRTNARFGQADRPETLGIIEVRQSYTDGEEYVVEIPLSGEEYQRHMVEWRTSPQTGPYSLNYSGDRLHKMTFRLLDAPNESGAVVFSTNIHVSYLFPAIGCLVTSAALLLLLLFMQPTIIRPEFVAITITSLILFWVFHSGAWVSNVYFTRVLSQSMATFVSAASLVASGEFPIDFYHSPLVSLLGIMTWIVEGAPSLSHPVLFNATYPTARFLMFVLFFSCFMPLLWTIYKYLGFGVSMLMAVMVPLFYPFINDLYTLAPDVFLVSLFMLFVAILIRCIFEQRFGWLSITLLATLLTLMVAYKITPMVIGFIVPIGLILSLFLKWTRIPPFEIAAVTIALLAAYPLSKVASKLLIGEPRMALPLEKVPFATNHLWEVIWAANGDYDDQSAHKFAKDGALRTNRVAAKTGLPVNHKIRHSQVAMVEVYKPGVLNALQQTPNFFYSTAFIRLYEHGIAFWRYPRSGGRQWMRWWRDRKGKRAEIDATRRNKMWKIAPLVFITKIIQFDLKRGFDIALIVASLVGAFLIARRELMLIFVGIIVAKYASMAGVHVLVRYANFTNVVMLLTLCVYLQAHFLWLKGNVKGRLEGPG